MPNTLSVTNARGPLRVSSQYARHVSDGAGGGGTPVLLLGDAAWSLVVQLTNAQIDTYLTDRASRGFNLILTQLIERHFSAGPPNNIDGVAPFTGANFTTPNNTYFLRADYIVTKAASLGIYVMFSPIYLGYSGLDEGWNDEIDAVTTGNMATWGTYCGNRYKDYRNIIWCMGGDRDPTAYMTKINAFANALVAADPNHLVTQHGNRGGLGGDGGPGAQSWFTLNNFYSDYTNVPDLADTAYTNSPTMPFFNVEAWYEDDIFADTPLVLRSQVYWTILGGGIGHIFGNDPIWNFAYDGVTADWTAALNSTGSQHMALAASLFRSLAWYTLVPDASHAWLTSGYGTLGGSDYAGAAKNAAGTLGMIYMPSNRTMAVVMSGFTGSVTARWYDPTNGTFTADAGSPVANSGSHNFSRATANSAGAADWVLVLTA